MNALKELERHGQAIWLDLVARGFIVQGDLARLVAEDGVKLVADAADRLPAGLEGKRVRLGGR